MTISELHKRLRYVNHGEVTLGQRCIRWSQSWFEDHGEGFPKWSSSPLKHSAVSGASRRITLGPLLNRVDHAFPSGAPSDDQMLIAASEGEPSLSGYDDPVALAPSGVVALTEPDPEMMVMLSLVP